MDYPKGDSMDFQDAVTAGFQRYFTFAGRATRSEYWFYTLFVLLVAFVINMIHMTLGTALGFNNQNSIYIYAFITIYLVAYIPLIPLTVRRLHDKGRSGWWFFLTFVPVIGAAILIIWFCQKGTEGPNDYGPDPLTAQA